MALRIKRSRLPELLHRAGKSQVDLANFLGVTESHISRVISLKSNLTFVKLKLTADYLNCKIDDLVEWEYD